VNARIIRRLLLAVAVTFASASAALLVVALYNSLAVLTPYRVAALCGLLLSAVCFTFIARKLHRLRDPVHEKNLAIGVLLAVVSSAISVIVLEIGLSVFRPAVTYRRARDISPSVFRKSDILPFQTAPFTTRSTVAATEARSSRSRRPREPTGSCCSEIRSPSIRRFPRKRSIRSFWSRG
jgi:hypothetical protein